MLHRLLAGKGLIIVLAVGFIVVESIVVASFLSLVHLKPSATATATKPT